ncbi:MAG: SDR family oxidoreductase [Acidobacteriaceae bacterium]|nr:SDR family oxidoreductase [Acidobacteriaceae bacterium]MBV9763811.1 SDR family oxidoreductase [Acidobacteriaceae bacterium]
MTQLLSQLSIGIARWSLLPPITDPNFFGVSCTKRLEPSAIFLSALFMNLLTKKISKIRASLPWLAVTGISAAAAVAATKLVRGSRPTLDLRGKVALITGGSRGLGFALAQELGEQGCRLALCARNAAELEEACGRLRKKSIEATPFTCDISDKSDAETLINRVLDELGAIDILINNAGHITVGPLEAFDHSDFERAMNVMFWGPLNLTFAVLPHMKSRRRGHIVNITSVGGRVSIPHLLPYSCAKFALVGFSTGLSTELRSQGIHVLTAVPGLMRTGSYLNAEFKGDARNEFAWFALLGNLPGFSVATRYAARCIRTALIQQKRVCTISIPAKILIAKEALTPEIMRATLQFVNRAILPSYNGSSRTFTGKHLSPSFSGLFKGLTHLGKLAAREFNE